jgi:integrase
MATLRKMLNQGVKDELITRAETPSYYPTTHEPNEAQGALFIEPKWYEPLRKHLREPLRSAFTLAYYWGVRVGELGRIRKGHIDRQNRTINLPGEITKMRKPRVLPLPVDVVIAPGPPDELAFPIGDIRGQWYDACVAIGAGHFLCKQCGARCQKRECETHGQQPLKRLRYVGITLRHTRHTAVRNMMDAGMERKRAKELTGHVTDSMFERYNIGRDKDVDEARDLMERFHKKRSC